MDEPGEFSLSQILFSDYVESHRLILLRTYSCNCVPVNKAFKFAAYHVT